MVFKDCISGQFLWKKYVKVETNKLYYSGIEEITRIGISIQAIICDGRKGLFQLFAVIPVQMCQFHQIQIITRFLTKTPKLEASKDLKHIALQMTKLTKSEFISALGKWDNEWDVFL